MSHATRPVWPAERWRASVSRSASAARSRSSSTLVVKVGGSVAQLAAAHDLVNDLAASSREIVVVHGAGPQISAEMERVGIPVEFVGGRRVTTAAGLDVVRKSMAAVNQAICAALGPAAEGLFGDEIGLRARRVPALGLVGEPVPSRPAAVLASLRAGRIPVVAPLAVGPLNVNADEAAAALAIGLGAERLLFVTDVPGLLREGGLVEAIDVDEAERLLDSGELAGGILPKLQAAVTAARLGVPAEIGQTAVVA